MNLAQVFVLFFGQKNVAQQPGDPLKSRLNGPLLQLPIADTQISDPLVHLGPASVNSISPIQQNSMNNGYDENNGYVEKL